MGSNEILYVNRATGTVEKEVVYGEAAMRWLYCSKLGRWIEFFLSSNPIFSRLYGAVQSTILSKHKIEPFITKFNINMEEFMPQRGRTESDPYDTFNHFFIRNFRPDRRSFVRDARTMPAFCEGRYFGHSEVNEQVTIPVKGKYLSAASLLGDKWHKTFANGPLLIARLCPVDYHRFHFPDGGQILDKHRIYGRYHSVNPMSIVAIPKVFSANERQVTILDTSNFGKLAYIEVGAICVGKIVQTYEGDKFNRGDEKGYFLFGGSTVVVIGEPRAWIPDQDIIENTSKGIETYIRLGDSLASVRGSIHS